MIFRFINKIKQKQLSHLLFAFDERFGLAFWENILFCNWFNPFATLWINLRSFPLAQAIKLPIWCYGQPRFYGLSGKMKIEGPVLTGMIRFNQTKPGAPSNMAVQTEIYNRGLIVFKGRGFIGTGNKIYVQYGAVLELGKHFKITDMCNVGCSKKITIGEQTWIVHRCQILDSNYHYVADFEKKIVANYKKTIYLGKGCWVCSNSTINGGTVLPDFTIVASNSLVNRDYSDIPDSSMIGGIPARFIKTGYRKIENGAVGKEIAEFYLKNAEGVFQIPRSAERDEYSFVDKFR
jgi:acetyltransferase-like isoleucine patch superfamily enzyme